MGTNERGEKEKRKPRIKWRRRKENDCGVNEIKYADKK